MILIFMMAMNCKAMVKSRKINGLQGYNPGFRNEFAGVSTAAAFL
jgi:hypothetical protein